MTSRWPQMKLEDCARIDFGTRVTRKVDSGTIFPVYGGGGETFRVDSFNRESCFIVSRFAMSENCVRYVSGKFFLNDSGLSVQTTQEGLSQSFLDRVLLANSTVIYGFGRGTAQKNLDIGLFRNLLIPIPTLEEQTRIVSKLDELLSIVDFVDNNISKTRLELEAFWRAVLDKSFLDEWPLTRLSEVSNLTMGKTPSRGNPKFWDKSKSTSNLWVSIGDLPREPLALIEDTKEYVSDEGAGLFSSVPAGTLLMSFKLSLGRTAFSAKALRTNEAIIAFRDLDKSRMVDRFLGYYLTHFDWTKATEGLEKVKGATLNKAKLQEFEVPVPPVEEQGTVVAKLDQISATLSSKKRILYSQKIEIDSLRKAVLSAALTGGL